MIPLLPYQNSDMVDGRLDFNDVIPGFYHEGYRSRVPFFGEVVYVSGKKSNAIGVHGNAIAALLGEKCYSSHPFFISVGESQHFYHLKDTVLEKIITEGDASSSHFIEYSKWFKRKQSSLRRKLKRSSPPTSQPRRKLCCRRSRLRSAQ